jgi:hypothetical protein
MNRIGLYLIGGAMGLSLLACEDDEPDIDVDSRKSPVGNYAGYYSSNQPRSTGDGGQVQGMVSIIAQGNNDDFSSQATVDMAITLNGKTDMLEDVVVNTSSDSEGNYIFSLSLMAQGDSQSDEDDDEDGLLDGGLFLGLGIDLTIDGEDGDGDGDLDVNIEQVSGKAEEDGDLDITLTTSSDATIHFDGKMVAQ